MVFLWLLWGGLRAVLPCGSCEVGLNEALGGSSGGEGYGVGSS